jgi:hypothetical protein
MDEDQKSTETREPVREVRGARKGPGHVAGLIVGILAIFIINAAGKGDFISNRYITGLIVGGGTYFIVSFFVDVLAGAMKGNPGGGSGTV